nr:MAG TPA: hypothetical protein [Caudoviricetes sp.]
MNLAYRANNFPDIPFYLKFYMEQFSSRRLHV